MGSTGTCSVTNPVGSPEYIITFRCNAALVRRGDPDRTERPVYRSRYASGTGSVRGGSAAGADRGLPLSVPNAAAGPRGDAYRGPGIKHGVHPAGP